MPGVITVVDFDDNTATLSSVVTGGVPPYSYAWHVSTESGFTPSEATHIDEDSDIYAYGDDFSSPQILVVGLLAETTYYFKLVVTDSHGNASTTPEVSVTTNETGWAPELQPSSMAAAHTALTDGVGETEIQLYADSTELPKASYGADEICWYGMNQPNNTGAQPGNGGNAAVYFGHLVDAGILGNRLEAQWDNIEIDPASPSWSIFNGYLAAIRNAGGTAIIETSYTPMHRTGQRYRNCPPLVFNNTPQAGSFVDDEIALSSTPVWLTQSSYERRGFAVVDSAATPTSVSEEGLAFRYTTPEQNNYTRTAAQGWADMYVAETAHWPIDITSLVVEVETSAGSGTYEEWTRVADIQDGTAGQKCYVADFTGRIGFKDGRMSSVCAAPATGAKVRASYDYFAAYNYGTEYTLDAIAGVLSRAGASGFSVPQSSDAFPAGSLDADWELNPQFDIAVPVASDGFAGPGLDANWVWNTEPTHTQNGTFNWDVGAVHATRRCLQTVSGSGDLHMSVKITAYSKASGSTVGIALYNADYSTYAVARVTADNKFQLVVNSGGGATTYETAHTFSAGDIIHLSRVGTTVTAWLGTKVLTGAYTAAATYAGLNAYIWDACTISFDDWAFDANNTGATVTPDGALDVEPRYGQRLYIGQPVNAGDGSTEDFTVSVKVTDLTATADYGDAAGLFLWEDASNYLRAVIHKDTDTIKWTVTGVLAGSSVSGSGMDGFGESDNVTITIQRSGDTFSVSLSPKTDYATNRSLTMAGFNPKYVGMVAYRTTETYTATFDDFLVDAPAGLADDVDIYSICADVDAMEAWGAALATQCSGKARFFSYGNEVTNGAGWTWDGTLALYAECLKAFRAGVKSIIADAQVGFAGFADAQFSQMTTLLASLDGADYDFAEGHFYKFDEGSIAAWKSARPDDFISRLAAAGDSAKPIFDGEMSAPCGVLSTSDAKGHANGPREKRQVEETIQMLMYQRAKGFLGVALWPGTDLEAKGVNEGNKWGGKDGLFYTTAGDAIPNGIKPVYYAVRNLAQCKGILVDLGSVQTVGSIVLSCSDRSQVESVRVLGSLTCTDATSAPPKVTAALTGGTSVFVVDVIDGDGALVTETWQAVCNAEGTFDVTGSVSGAQGTATKGVLFESNNTVCSFTIPDATYTEGQTFEWGTFKGDDFAQLGTAEGAAGAGDITVDCADASARYLLIEFTRAVGALYIGLKQVTVLDDADAEITPAGYVVEGWQAEFIPA